jgi:hypothetical protein
MIAHMALIAGCHRRAAVADLFYAGPKLVNSPRSTRRREGGAENLRQAKQKGTLE